MVDVSYQMVLSTLQTVGILVGIIYYIFNMRNSQKNQQMQLETRQAQLFMQIYSRQYDRETRENIHFVDKIEYENYEDFIEKYGIENNPDYLKISSLVTYYEGIGVLVKRKLIDPSIVDDLMSSPIIRVWEKLRGYVEERRERTGHVESAEHVEYLYEIIKAIRDKQRQESEKPST
jgi:hypothetical protein